jgi:hypothetical protein
MDLNHNILENNDANDQQNDDGHGVEDEYNWIIDNQQDDDESVGDESNWMNATFLDGELKLRNVKPFVPLDNSNTTTTADLSTRLNVLRGHLSEILPLFQHDSVECLDLITEEPLMEQDWDALVEYSHRVKVERIYSLCDSQYEQYCLNTFISQARIQEVGLCLNYFFSPVEEHHLVQAILSPRYSIHTLVLEQLECTEPKLTSTFSSLFETKHLHRTIVFSIGERRKNPSMPTMFKAWLSGPNCIDWIGDMWKDGDDDGHPPLNLDPDIYLVYKGRWLCNDDTFPNSDPLTWPSRTRCLHPTSKHYALIQYWRYCRKHGEIPFEIAPQTFETLKNAFDVEVHFSRLHQCLQASPRLPRDIVMMIAPFL